MKLLAWNIQQGGAKRAMAIVDVILRHAPDILVLTELRRSSSRLLRQLAERGWKYQVSGISQSPIAAAAVLSRDPLLPLAPSAPSAVLPGRWLEAWLPNQGIVVAGVYGPLKHEPYDDFWRAALNTLPERARGRYILAGDLNTGESLMDATSATFFCSDYFVKLRASGLTDVWRERNTDARQYSYHHRLRAGRVGAGFRLDHVFVSSVLARHAVACGYDRTVLANKISDHAPVHIEFALPRL
jgi:exodeoxyribonuclease-3